MVCTLGKLFLFYCLWCFFALCTQKITGFTGVQITSVRMFLFCYKEVTVVAIPLVFNITDFLFLMMCRSASCCLYEVLCHIWCSALSPPMHTEKCNWITGKR